MQGSSAALRLAIARTVSIIGHPLIVLPVAALIAASDRGASIQHLQFISATLAILGIIIMGYSIAKVRSGRWGHIDASVRSERKSLNTFLAILCFTIATIFWVLQSHIYIAIALALSGMLVSISLLVATWVKLSLHTAFATFATALLWPNDIAVAVGILITAIIIWSRLTLDRHNIADVTAGLLLGALAGITYQLQQM